MSTESCLTCRFLHAWQTNVGVAQTNYVCRRYPPVQHFDGGGTHPRVQLTDWCGEYVKRTDTPA